MPLTDRPDAETARKNILSSSQVSLLEKETRLRIFEGPGETEIRASPVCVFSLPCSPREAIYHLSGLGFSRLELCDGCWLLSR